MLRVSHDFSRIDMLFFIAESTTYGQIIGIDNITSILGLSFLPISWRYQQLATLRLLHVSFSRLLTLDRSFYTILKIKRNHLNDE